MYACPFIPITDKAHFPILTAGADRPADLLMGCEDLTFLALEDTKQTRALVPNEGGLWHTYGDTRWLAAAVWVEFPMPPGRFSGHAGVLVMTAAIPQREEDPLAWVAANNPLVALLPEFRGEASIEKRYDLLRAQSEDKDDPAGPADATPRHVQCYCIFHYHNQGTPRYVASYLDILNQEGLPIHKYRNANVNKADIPHSQLTLHSLFSLNRARRSGAQFITVNQLPTFVPASISPDRLPPQWTRFHPSRVLRLRPALRAIPSPPLLEGIIHLTDFQRTKEVRRCESITHMLAFANAARPRELSLYRDDDNISMAAFIHRANGGAIYTLPDRLVEEFDNTECGEVHIGDITLPFPSCYLSFRPPEPVILNPGAAVDGCYLQRQGDEYLMMLTTRLEGVDYERSISLTCLDPAFSLHLPANDPDLSINAAVERGIEAFLAENAPPTEDLTQTIERPDGTTTTVVDARAHNRCRRIEQFKAQEPGFRKCLNIVVNAACFVSFRPEDIYETWAGNPLGELLTALDDPGTTHAGRARKRAAVRDIDEGDFIRIKICGKDLFAERPTEGPTGTGKSPRAHWRRGHWRRQRHGPGLSLVHMRWIRPTLVCKDAGTAADTRVYEVQSAPDTRMDAREKMAQ